MIKWVLHFWRIFNFLLQIEIESMQTKKHYVFPCGRWLAEDEDDGCIIRELPAEGEDIKKPQPRESDSIRTPLLIYLFTYLEA